MPYNDVPWYQKLWAGNVALNGYAAQNFFLYNLALMGLLVFTKNLLDKAVFSPEDQTLLDRIVMAWSAELLVSNFRNYYKSYIEMSKSNNIDPAELFKKVTSSVDITNGTDFNDFFDKFIVNLEKNNLNKIALTLKNQKNALSSQYTNDFAEALTDPKKMGSVQMAILNKIKDNLESQPTSPKVQSFCDKLSDILLRHCDVMGTEAKAYATTGSVLSFLEQHISMSHMSKYIVNGIVGGISLPLSVLAQFSNLAKGRSAMMRFSSNILSAEAAVGFGVTYAVSTIYGYENPFIRSFVAFYATSFVEAIPIAIAEKTGAMLVLGKAFDACRYVWNGCKTPNHQGENQPLINSSSQNSQRFFVPMNSNPNIVVEEITPKASEEATCCTWLGGSK